MRSHYLKRLFCCLPSVHSYSRLSKGAVSANAGLARWRTFILDDLPIVIGLPLSLALSYATPSVAVLISCLLFIYACLYLFRVAENSLVYAANQPSHSRFLCFSPAEHGFNTWQKVSLYPDGHYGPCVIGYMLLLDNESERSIAPTLYMLHGNAGNIGDRLPLCRRLVDQLQCNLFMIDYRGFGLSSGHPSEAGLHADVEVGFVHLLSRTDIATNNIFMFGQSLGGALAIKIATGSFRDSVCGVIVENSFTSIPLIARHLFSASFGLMTRYIPPTWAFSNRYSSLELLKKSTQVNDGMLPPFLFVSGGSDEIIPPHMMRELSSAVHSQADERAMSPSEFLSSGKDGLVYFKSGRHNDTWLCDGYGQVLAKFISYAKQTQMTRTSAGSVVASV